MNPPATAVQAAGPAAAVLGREIRVVNHAGRVAATTTTARRPWRKGPVWPAPARPTRRVVGPRDRRLKTGDRHGAGQDHRHPGDDETDLVDGQVGPVGVDEKAAEHDVGAGQNGDARLDGQHVQCVSDYRWRSSTGANRSRMSGAMTTMPTPATTAPPTAYPAIASAAPAPRLTRKSPAPILATTSARRRVADETKTLETLQVPGGGGSRENEDDRSGHGAQTGPPHSVRRSAW